MDINEVYTSLIDIRNEELWHDVNKIFNIVLMDSYEPNYITNFKPEQVTIYVDLSNLDPAPFTHELLHVSLKRKGVLIAQDYENFILTNDDLYHIFSLNLRDHIGNCLEHVKMLPSYLDMGFDPKKFNSDFYDRKMNDGVMGSIKQHYRVNGAYRRDAVDLYIGKFFAMLACNNKTHNYSRYHEAFKKLDAKLYSLLFDFWNDWITFDMNDPNDTYDEILELHMEDLDEWVKGKRFI